jgi:hypothetical protein
MTNKSPRYDNFMDDLRGKMKAYFEASEDLKAEFLSADSYVAYKMNEPAFRALAIQHEANCVEADNLAALAEAEAVGPVR